MHLSGVEGIAKTATQYQLEQLLFIVDHVNTYRDWDWLDAWLSGRGPENYTPDMVIKVYSNEEYWVATSIGDVTRVNAIRDAILGIH
jgi:hypothetical protein